MDATFTSGSRHRRAWVSCHRYLQQRARSITMLILHSPGKKEKIGSQRRQTNAVDISGAAYCWSYTEHGSFRDKRRFGMRFSRSLERDSASHDSVCHGKRRIEDTRNASCIAGLTLGFVHAYRNPASYASGKRTRAILVGQSGFFCHQREFR